VRFEKLKPGTKYVYRVGDGSSWSEWFQFKTASNEPEPFTFIYLGDAQNDVRALWSRVLREAHADAPRAAFILHAGDLINKGAADGEWGEWHGAGGWLNAMIPQVPTPGNHEYVRESSLGGEEQRVLTAHWRPQFTLPENGPAGLEETVYWIEHQGTLIVSLNSNERLEEQAEWLDTLLAERKAAWTILTFHHPVYSAEKSRDNAKLRGLWKPILDKHRVDLVLTGHDHAYARSGFDVPENVPEGTQARSEAGTVYVVSVSGPKMYTVGREDWMQRAAAKTQLYQILRIEGDTLRYEARTAVGDLYDAFLLKKQDGEPNELIEQVPDTPERL
jgi:2',3'-cyclic-nucleotide 2'-phosphodiesterase (5'-nucleotidase family)